MRPMFLRGRVGERGQAVILVALAASTLLLAVGLAFDAGRLFVARREQQVAADAAAWAGAIAIYNGKGALAARDAAFANAARNGFTDGAGAKVSVFTPPATGAFAGDPSSIEVVIERDVATQFLQGPASGFAHVSGRGVGGASPFRSGHAILALSPTGTAFIANGNGAVTATGGGVVVDSTDPAAAQLLGNGGVNAPYSYIGGGVIITGNASFHPPAQTGHLGAPDPFLYLPGPPIANLPTFVNTRVATTTVLDPGVYVGGITIDANGRAIMRSGTYVLKGGGLTISGNGSMRGETPTTGLLLFNTHDNYPGQPGVCGYIAISGNGVVDLHAAQTGPYAGLLLWQDRACTNLVSITGNGALTTIVGTVYSPTAMIALAGNGTASLTYDAQFIGNAIQWAGNGNITINYRQSNAAAPLLPALVE